MFRNTSDIGFVSQMDPKGSYDDAGHTKVAYVQNLNKALSYAPDTGLCSSVLIEQRWINGGSTDCSFDTNPMTSVVVNSTLQCLALMQPHSGENRVASFNKATGECSIVIQSQGSAPYNAYVTQGSTIRKEQNPCPEVWEKVFEVDSDGTVLFGDVSQLVSAIKQGSYMRIHQKPNLFLEADDLIWKGSVVCGSTIFVLSKASWDVFEPNMHWQFTRICSSGMTYVSKPYLGIKSNLPEVQYSRASTWFVRKHKESLPNPVYCNTKTSPSTCGDLVNLTTAVKHGFEIRLSTVAGTQEMYSYCPSRVEMQLSSGNCKVVGQMFWKAGGYGGSGLDFRFFDPLYWWIRLYSTGGTYPATRWYIGDYSLRKQTTSTAANDWFVDHCWMFSYSHTAAGNPEFGSLQTLVKFLLLGRRVRIVFDSVAMEADAIMIEGDMVLAQLVSQIETQTPITFPSNTAHFKLIRLSTNGTFLADIYNLGSSTRVQQDKLVSAASWIIETRQWILVLRTDENGVALTGSKSNLEQAIRAGSRLRCLVNIDSLKRLIMTVDNTDVDTDGNVAAQFFRLIEFGNSAAFVPYWRITILTTNGEMKETHWTLGENVNRGNTVASVAIDWFVDQAP
ncbi:hypothetical protein KP79_PYT03925 [Mizuhopecten yessoensis]|uniref:Uncharacterized protein n=1 Tax=Mizuhopecten yessoensis TaxID=6573 RepID=A0A210PRE8_MIZYE|nr:hypothetical protein KP79_PYT03925 [Mizuhopecten yessoensis]